MRLRTPLLTCIAAAATLLSAVLVPTLARAATACKVTYTKAWDNGSGFGANLTLQNLGDPWASWTLTYTWPGAQQVTQGWSGNWTQSARDVTVTNLSWNGGVPTGGSVGIGFNGTYTGANTDPSTFAINGVTCGGTVPSPSSGTNRPPTVSLTSPANGASYNAPATIGLAATAGDPDGNLARVEFYSGATLLNTDTTAPYEFAWSNVGVGSYSLSARAVDAAGLSATSATASVTVSSGPSGPAPALHVSGNRILTAGGTTYRLLGVNRSGGEFACIQGNGMWDGPMDQASITVMRSWKVRVVRIPLNEECWLGTPSVPSGGASGAVYQQNVKNYVNLLIQNGITPIVEMHWNYGVYTGPASACSNAAATCQKPMPDAQYAPTFWTSVANAFKGNDAVILDLFNEPYPEYATGSDATGWACWRDGGSSCSGFGYQVAGFQSLVNAVRATGATNIIMVGGLRWSNNISQWLQHKPSDPLNNLVAFAHIYNFNSCISTGCWDAEWAPIAAQVPLTISEIGQNDCSHWFIDQVMNWADAHGVGYLGWTWNTWDCSSGPSLISNHNGTPTTFGQGLKDRLALVSS